MPADALLSFNVVSGVADTVTASGHTNAVTIPGVQKSRCLYVRIRYSGASTNSAGVSDGATLQFKVQVQDNMPLTGMAGAYFDHTVNANKILTLTTTAQEGTLYLPVTTDGTSVQLAYFFGGSGGSNTVSFIADLVNSNI